MGYVAEILVKLQDIKGLEIYVNWVKENIGDSIPSNRADCLNNLRSSPAIPKLIELLEISFKQVIKVDGFSPFSSKILDIFTNIALESKENFNEVITALKGFMKNKSTISGDVKYIVYTIEHIDAQFNMKNTPSYTIEQIKEKLALLKN
ncbi:MAG: hypothetical protein K8S56_07340 [Candidatus Cloacimonetes bacterium]|nr:hypothetical protein [Candidatus Cloacimonadota bacterium]